ncbi:MAG: SH3 domain-containing protein [Chloroflexi bacterium]|nr:SH3 domain-containing protein [Chloroflexota bacterium]MCY4247603.1 SH3 domain-containing protein [Chloroflexota bacterium]
MIIRRLIKSLCLAILLLQAGVALAADIRVDADCSLANAIRSANGEDQVAPANNCEMGDAVSEDNTGSDTITITEAGTVDGAVVLATTLEVTSEVVIEGIGFVIDGEGNRLFAVRGGSLTIKDLTLTDGWADSDGGGILATDSHLALYNSVVRHNYSAGAGGGIAAINSEVLLIDSLVSSNETRVWTAPAGDKSIAEAEAPDLVVGAGIYFNGAENTLIIDKSGISDNLSRGEGGGIFVLQGSAAISNTTIRGNSAAGMGGGLMNRGSATLTHVTIIENRAEAGAGIYDQQDLQLYNSILTGNVEGDCGGDLEASIGNLIRDGSCGHDGLSADPRLLLLAGAPAYYVPDLESPVIDAGDSAYCLANDQRGILRPPDACDIGAAEQEEGAFSFQIQSAVAARTATVAQTGGAGEGGSPADGTWSEPDGSLCNTLAAHIVVVDAPNNTHCREVDAAGVGNADLLNYGFIYAVDIFGEVAAVDVCFAHDAGTIVLLDAAYSPRRIVPLRTWSADGMVCANTDRAGTAVLMPVDFLVSGVVPEPVYDLSGCSVTPVDILNLRVNPSTSSEILLAIPAGTRLSATMRTTHWFRVAYGERVGWLHGDYLNRAGAC